MPQSWVMSGDKKNGTHFIYNAGSNSELCIFIHGIGTYHYCFDSLATWLYSKGYSILQYDNLGMGFSDYPEDGEDSAIWNGSGHVKQLHRLLVDLKLENTPKFLIGHSMGGAIATLYGATNSQLIKGIVLLSPAGVLSPWETKSRGAYILRILPSCFISSIFEGLKKDAVNINNIRRYGDFLDESNPTREESCQHILRQHQNNKDAIRALFNCARFFPLWELHDHVTAVGASGIEVLLLHGEQDHTVFPTPTTNIWAKAVSAKPASSPSSIELVPGAHSFFLENPHETRDRIVQWFDRVNRHGASARDS